MELEYRGIVFNLAV